MVGTLWGSPNHDWWSYVGKAKLEDLVRTSLSLWQLILLINRTSILVTFINKTNEEIFIWIIYFDLIRPQLVARQFRGKCERCLDEHQHLQLSRYIIKRPWTRPRVVTFPLKDRFKIIHTEKETCEFVPTSYQDAFVPDKVQYSGHTQMGCPALNPEFHLKLQ